MAGLVESLKRPPIEAYRASIPGFMGNDTVQGKHRIAVNAGTDLDVALKRLL